MTTKIKQAKQRSTTQDKEPANLVDSLLPKGVEDYLLWAAAKPEALSHLSEGAVRQWLGSSERLPTEAYPALIGALEGALKGVKALEAASGEV